MSDFKLPDLPSDDELGIGDEEGLEEYLDDEGSELSHEEMQALLGESPKPMASRGPAAPPDDGAEPASKKKKGRKGWGISFFSKGRKKKEKGEDEPREHEGADREEKAEAPKPRRERPKEGPPSRWRGPATLALLVLGAWFASLGRVVPSPAAANAADTAFSSARAMSHIVEIARAAHPPGSPEHDRVRSYILDELRDLGLEPAVQTATSMIRSGSLLSGATVRNIVARVPGANDTGAVLVTAHYDGRGPALAAGDAGSGVVSILESLRALRASGPLRNDLIVLITDAEELGLLGARAFVDEHPWMADVRAVISVEARGAGGPSMMFETGAEYGWIVEAYKAAAPRPFANSLAYEIYKILPLDTDFTPFREAGKQGLNFAAFGNAHVYHQVYDNPENLHEGTLQHQGLNTLSMMRRLGNEDLTVVNGPDVVYFTLPMLGLVTYHKGWVWPLTGLVILQWLALGAAVRRRGWSMWGVAAGTATAVVSAAALYGAGLWLRTWLSGLHPELGALHGSAFHSEGWYVLALAALAMLAVTGLWSLARWKFTVPELAAGSGMLVVLIVVAVTWLVPLGAMNLQWPALAFGIATAVAFLPATGGIRIVRWALMAVAGTAVVIMLTPLIELLWLGLSFAMAPYLGVMMVVALLTALPALDTLREPNAWWAPLASAVLAAVFLGMGVLQAKPSPQRPVPSTLIYTLHQGTGEALWATQPEVGFDDPARDWAEAQTGVSFSQSISLSAFGPREDAYAVAPAPIVEAPAVTARVESDAVLAGVRRVRVAARSELGAEMLLFLFPNGGPELVGLNGAPLPTMHRGGEPVTEPPTRVEHWGSPDSLVLLDFVVPAADTALTFEIVEHSLRPGALVGGEVFQRPPELAANIVRFSDRAMIRTPVTFALSLAGSGAPGAEEPPERTATPDALPPDTTGAAASADTMAIDTVPAPDTIGG